MAPKQMPAQKPGKSCQTYETPWEFVHRVERSLGIEEFKFDLAATEANKKGKWWIDESMDSLAHSWKNDFSVQDAWCWLNPPYTSINNWAAKCCEESYQGVKVAFLVPASVGANWFRDYVYGHSRVLALNGRLSFMASGDPYPKDLMLCLYGQPPGFEVWNWRED